MMPARSLAALLLAALLAAGCTASRPGTGGGEAAYPPAYARQIAPFDVLGPDGEPMAFPFLGGLNVPRPQFADIDGDGDPDLFVQEKTGAVMFFENVGTTDAPDYAWRTDQYAGIDVGEWFRFADLDQDGDLDLLAEQPYSYVRYFRNEGTAADARFVPLADTLRDVAGDPIFSDRQNIPNVADIDCDEKPDLFLGRMDGTISRYELARMEDDGTPRFRFVEDRFQDIEIVAQFGTLRHGANTLIFVDIDEDGDLDLFWGDYFESSLLLVENTGTCSTPSLRGTPRPFPPSDPVNSSGYNAPAFADLDGDADLDLLVGVLGGAFNPIRTAASNLYHYEATADGYALRTRRFLDGLDVGTESFPALADLDADGDLDLLLANKISPDDLQTGRLFRYENVGTPSTPRFQLADSLTLLPTYHYAPAPVDVDADGDLDLLVGTWKGDVALYRNDGSAEAPDYVEANPVFVQLTRGSNAVPTLGDLDGDGDLDLLVGESSGTINYYRNVGTPTAPDFAFQTDEYLGLDVGRRSAPALRDLDGDGDLDLIVGTERGAVLVYRNAGTPTAPDFVEDAALALPELPYATPAFGDLDGDGDLDLLSGVLGGGVLYFENTAE